MRLGAIPIAIGLGILMTAVSGAWAQETRTFENPEIDGRRLDLCLVWGGQCGKPAADAWCREGGFAEAREWKPAFDIGATSPTLVLTDRRLCDGAGCDGFASITCEGERQRLRRLPAGATLRPGAGKEPPPEEPVLMESIPVEPWTTGDVIDPRIDVQAQFALMRMFAGEPSESRVASSVLAATKEGALAGVYREDQRAPALRARALGGGWWDLVPRGRSGVCVTGPGEEPPLIAMRRGAERDPEAYDRALAEAWAECGLPAAPPRPYVETLPPRPTSGKGCAFPHEDGQLNVQVYDADTGAPLEGIRMMTRNMDAPGARWTRLSTDLAGFVVVAPAAEGRYGVVALGDYEGEEQVHAGTSLYVDVPRDCRRTVRIPMAPWEEPITPD